MARIVLFTHNMTTFVRLSAILLLLLGCYGCESEAGPADAIVGAWEGSEIGSTDSGPDGDKHWTRPTTAFITNVSAWAVRVSSPAFSHYCEPVFDLGPERGNAVRPTIGVARCDSGTLVFENEVLTLDVRGSVGHLTYDEVWTEKLTLTRVP
jgi:hypothetical protein